MITKSVNVRVLHYLLLGIFCLVTPYLVTILLIIFTGDREAGMTLAVIPSVLVTHYLFAKIFLKVKPIIKYTVPLLTASICVLSLKLILPIHLIKTGIDVYGYWDLNLTHFAVAVIVWELTYQTLVKVLR